MRSAPSTSRFQAARWVCLVALCIAAAGCHAIAGAAVGVVTVGAAFLLKSCDDSVDITVFDGRTGRPFCDAEVVAIRGERVREVLPCYHAALGEGTWTLRASHPGLVTQTSRVVVSREDGCEPAVHTVQFTLSAAPVPHWRRPAAPPALAPSAPQAAPPAPRSEPAPAHTGSLPPVKPEAPDGGPAPATAPVTGEGPAQGDAPPATPPVGTGRLPPVEPGAPVADPQ